MARVPDFEGLVTGGKPAMAAALAAIERDAGDPAVVALLDRAWAAPRAERRPEPPPSFSSSRSVMTPGLACSAIRSASAMVMRARAANCSPAKRGDATAAPPTAAIAADNAMICFNFLMDTPVTPRCATPRAHQGIPALSRRWIEDWE